MFTEIEKNQIRKRLSAIPDLGHRDTNQRGSLEKLFDEICAMEDTSARTKKEKAFQKQLIDLEGYVSYLQGRMKI